MPTCSFSITSAAGKFEANATLPMTPCKSIRAENPMSSFITKVWVPRSGTQSLPKIAASTATGMPGRTRASAAVSMESRFIAIPSAMVEE
jgi:hypothetical protein